MRTTFELDDDLAEKLRRIAEQRRTSQRRVLNELIRRGLSAQEPQRKRTAPFRVKVFHSAYRPGVDPLRLNQLVDELEVREKSGDRR